MTTAITRLNETEGTFSERFPVLFEEPGRLEKAEKIIAVLGDYFHGRAPSITVVDIGCSTGIMARQFAGAFGRVIGMDTDQVGVAHGQQLARQAGISPDKLRLCAGDGCFMPLADESVDAVICNQVYEHVDDQRGLVDEIRRVLRPGGACYLGIGTRHVFIEGHYQLPFLSWLPHPVADVYMKLAGKKSRYDVRLLSYRNLRELVRQFGVIDYTLDIIKHPEQYADGGRGTIRRWVQRWPLWLLKAVLPAIPLHVWVLVKPQAGTMPSAGQFVYRNDGMPMRGRQDS
jgi:SAM-dependent methyltransferase